MVYEVKNEESVMLKEEINLVFFCPGLVFFHYCKVRTPDYKINVYVR